MFPGGHARNENVSIHETLQHKFKVLGKLALDKQELIRLKIQLENIGEMSNEDLLDLYDCNIKFADEALDTQEFENIIKREKIEEEEAIAATAAEQFEK